MKAPPPARPPARIEPISEDLRVLRMTVGRGFVDDLEAVRDALSHVVPDRRLETVLHECIRRTLKAIRARRQGAAPRGTPATTQAKGRHVSAAVRREVWRRDEGRCAFVSDDGRRCGSTYLLEIHHLHPYALGGPATTTNLSLRCAGHNRYHAAVEMQTAVRP